MPAAWAIRPQLGSRAVERGLHQRRVGDRPRHPLGLLRVRGPGHRRSCPTRVGALAVGDDLERELQQDRVEQPRRQRPARARRSPGARTVSLVLIWPSTVMRSNEPSTRRRKAGLRDRRPRRRSARSRASSRSPARSSPRPWPGRRRSPRRRGRVQRFGPASVVMIASANASPPLAERLAAASRDPGDDLPRSSSGTPIVAGLGDRDGGAPRAPSASAAASRIASASR